ncbi:MAG: hypothetical protein KC910_09105, partial [Candidatus Eremiobacteraeota bacterium]|nr:hypothetical protein [Candidatus Eremiobacteraeota bacterium]
MVRRRRQLERFLLPRLVGSTWSHPLGQRTSYDGHTLGMRYEHGLRLEVTVQNLSRRAVASVEVRHQEWTYRSYSDIQLRSRRDLIRLCRLVDRARRYVDGRDWKPITHEGLTASDPPAAPEAIAVYQATLGSLFDVCPPVNRTARPIPHLMPEWWFPLRSGQLNLDREAFFSMAQASRQSI